MLQNLKARHSQLTKNLYQKLGQRDTVLKRIAELQTKIKEHETHSVEITKGSLFLQSLSDETRKQILGSISSIVTDALQKIKDPNLEFRMLLSTERNQIDVEFKIFDKAANQEYDVLNSCGGSIADIITFPLRISLLLKWSPALAPILILDENFKFVSVQDQEALAEFVRQVSEQLGIQTILVTHSERVSSKANRIFQVSKQNGISVVEVQAS